MADTSLISGSHASPDITCVNVPLEHTSTVAQHSVPLVQLPNLGLQPSAVAGPGLHRTAVWPTRLGVRALPVYGASISGHAINHMACPAVPSRQETLLWYANVSSLDNVPILNSTC